MSKVKQQCWLGELAQQHMRTPVHKHGRAITESAAGPTITVAAVNRHIAA
jgi:hypothetical protein